MFLSTNMLQKHIKLLPIDFSKPWWRLITNQKWIVSFVVILSFAAHAFWSIIPFLIAYLFTIQSIGWTIALFGLCFIVDAAHAFARQINAQFQLQCIHSIYQNAHQYLLTVDPCYHVHRSSGAILGKIDRAARGYEDLLDQLTFEFAPLVVGLITMMIVLLQHSFFLAAVVTTLFCAMIGGGYAFAQYFCKPWEKDFIASDDQFRATAVENLAQVELVRASFASDYMSEKLSAKVITNAQTESRLWLAYTLASFVLNCLYLLAFFSVLFFILHELYQGTISIVSATALAIAYIKNTQLLLKVIHPFRRLLRGWTAVKDLFDFIPTFGKQGFPVLGSSNLIIQPHNDIQIEAQSISFDYKTAELFNNHTFVLQCLKNQKNKLYGIIGPSGSGKTTLLSILGGQLKPTIGKVSIDDIDIYSITDSERRQLICLQGQTASTIQGTVRYNLLFGLPNNHPYNDQALLSVLDRVGLLKILQANQGLETMLGERGLNLSGGQRQRLNFASLYLRAGFYKPALILIDEPTSSLDEISEAAITSMIIELAESSITLVIAHRLRTVEQAMGLIDLSLITQEKEITSLTPEELLKHSTYYQQLTQGHIELDS